MGFSRRLLIWIAIAGFQSLTGCNVYFEQSGFLVDDGSGGGPGNNSDDDDDDQTSSDADSGTIDSGNDVADDDDVDSADEIADNDTLPDTTDFTPPSVPSSIPSLGTLELRNPCGVVPLKNWFIDENPVTVQTGIPSPSTYLVQPAETKSTVDLSLLSYSLPLRFIAVSSESGGLYSDAYATQDNAHTIPSADYTDPIVGKIFLSHLSPRIPVGYTVTSELHKAGVAFTSQSTVGMGHWMIEANSFINPTECNSLYRGIVRAGPAYLSYQSGKVDRRVSQYDGLQAFFYNSIGQSGSEIAAIAKMGIAASGLSKTVKSAMKRLGLQAPYLLTSFRKNLPYVRAGSNSRDFADDIFHQPAYLSGGEEFASMIDGFNWTHPHFEAMAYPNHPHAVDMIRDAAALKALPPIANFEMTSLETYSNIRKTWQSRALSDTKFIPSSGLTIVKIHVPFGEDNIKARVNFSKSYDPQNFPVKLRIQNLYHNHTHVKVTQISPLLYEIEVPRKANLPLGAVPIIAYTHNGIYESLPTFINIFFEPENYTPLGFAHPAVSPDPSMLTTTPRSEVFNNKVPTFVVRKKVGSMAAAIMPQGQALRVDSRQLTELSFSCEDPEGFPTRLYQWKTDTLRLSDPTHLTIPMGSPIQNSTVHLICSDGTGAYAGLFTDIQISNQ
jgi:hypothetical protein